MKSTNSLHLILFLISYPLVIFSVPDPFCDDHFDDDDCGEPPVTMFYYYKPGSRCEMRTWRGCPTLNKFPDQFSCLHFCVVRIWGDPNEIPEIPPIDSSVEKSEQKEKEKAAEIAKIVEDQNEWKEEIKALEVEDIKAIDEILDNVVDVVEHHVKEKLKQQNTGSKGNNLPIFIEEEKPISYEEPDGSSAEESTTPVNLDDLFQAWGSGDMLDHIQDLSEEEVKLAMGKK